MMLFQVLLFLCLVHLSVSSSACFLTRFSDSEAVIMSVCLFCLFADTGSALRVLRSQRSLGGFAESPREEVHHAGLAPPLPHPGDKMAAV